MSEDEDKVIMEITLSSNKDRRPLQMVSGEQVDKWRAIERVARRLVYNRYLVVESQPLRTLINHLEVTLAMPSQEEDAAK